MAPCPLPAAALVLLILTMCAFYSTTFDSLTMVISMYSCRRLKPGAVPHKGVRAFWAVVFIIFPIGLIFAQNSLNSLQSVSIIAALPISVVMVLIVAAFLKDVRAYLKGDRAGRKRRVETGPAPPQNPGPAVPPKRRGKKGPCRRKLLRHGRFSLHYTGPRDSSVFPPINFFRFLLPEAQRKLCSVFCFRQFEIAFFSG